MVSESFMARLVTAVVWALALGLASSHGFMGIPPQRGCTNGNQYAKWLPKYDVRATIDYGAHFPAGDKSIRKGSGGRSQQKAAGRQGWTPYTPASRNFRPRAGVCGDTLWGRDHLRGGRFYNGGRIHKTYVQGGTIEFTVAVTEHHNGYFAFWVCDIAKCGGEISWKCFQRGHCYKLNRAWDQRCESRADHMCAPTDPKNPHRWYLPCPKAPTTVYGGGGRMRYHLPKHLSCKHCVIQWYWASANSCNPPGLIEFFTSKRSPWWGKCRGQGDAVGGWRRWPARCGGRRFSEEYLQCADIRINPSWTKPPAKKPPPKKPTGANPFMKVVIIGDMKNRRDIYNGQNVVFNAKPYKHITFLAVTKWKVDGVSFEFNGKHWWYEQGRPYVFGGKKGGWFVPWKQPWYNVKFSLAVVAQGHRLQSTIVLQR